MIVDVSMTIRPGAVFRLGTPAVQIAAEGFFHESEGKYESIMLSLSAHTATHVDLVYLARRLEPERMVGPGKLVDVRQCSNREIQLADVDRQVGVERGDFVFFRTGWSELAGTSAYYDHPELSPEVIGWLIEKRVNAVGIDALGLGQGRKHGEHDRRLARHDIYVIENLANLDAVTHSPFRVYCLPLKIEDTDAIPARILVEFDG